LFVFAFCYFSVIIASFSLLFADQSHRSKRLRAVGGVDRVALSVIQRNIRRWLAMRNWQWWKLYTRVKPLLTQAKAEDEMRKMAEDYEATKAELAKISKQKKELEEQNVVLLQQKNDMFMQMQAEQVCWLFGLNGASNTD